MGSMNIGTPVWTLGNKEQGNAVKTKVKASRIEDVEDALETYLLNRDPQNDTTVTQVDWDSNQVSRLRLHVRVREDYR